jgi:hypothetical protein
MVARVVMHQINKTAQWHATCDCGRAWYGTKAECEEGIEQHGARDGLVIGPRTITEKLTVSVPRKISPGQLRKRERWCWHAYNEDEEAAVSYYASGRTEWEAIEELFHINDIRRMTMLDLKNSDYPKSSHWLAQPRQDDQRCVASSATECDAA